MAKTGNDWRCRADSEYRGIIEMAELGKCPMGKFGPIAPQTQLINIDPQITKSRAHWDLLFNRIREWNSAGDNEAWYANWSAGIPTYGCDCVNEWRKLTSDFPPPLADAGSMFKWAWSCRNSIRRRRGQREFPYNYALRRYNMPSQYSKARLAEVPRKLILHHYLSPGDVLMLTACLDDLHAAYPGHFQTDVRVSVPDIFDNNPHVTPIADDDPESCRIEMNYPQYQWQDDLPIHFAEAFSGYLEERLQIPIPARARRGAIYLTEEEKSHRPFDGRYWLVISGGKSDYTCKHPDILKLRTAILSMPDAQFIQVGEEGKCGSLVHTQPRLGLPNVIDGIGQTTRFRDLIVLAAHAEGAICGVTALMHLMGALNKPCVVLAGGREAPTWEKYPDHVYFDSMGKLPCCQERACGRSRTVALKDGGSQDQSLCQLPVMREGSPPTPKCQEMIDPYAIVRAVDEFRNQNSLLDKRISPAILLPHEQKRADQVQAIA